MYQNHITVKNRHKKFIQDICKTETVYALESSDGYATSSSNYYDDENGEPVGIICFWSEKARAKSCIKEGWKQYSVVEFPLSDFMENWCIGMENDGLIIGTQFDQNMFGYEAEPLELILDLIKELKSLDKDLNLRKFDGIIDFEKQTRSLIE